MYIGSGYLFFVYFRKFYEDDIRFWIELLVINFEDVKIKFYVIKVNEFVKFLGKLWFILNGVNGINYFYFLICVFIVNMFLRGL